jgi:hypothetical protein
MARAGENRGDGGRANMAAGSDDEARRVLAKPWRQRAGHPEAGRKDGRRGTRRKAVAPTVGPHGGRQRGWEAGHATAAAGADHAWAAARMETRR